jgi:hypothetical protein
MSFPISNKPRLTLPLLLGTVTFWGIATLVPEGILQAHETEVEGKIAATWHIEPNDAPEAGKPAQVWIALTGSGGKVIPLADCDCTLKIWSVPPGEQPLLEPDLTSISAEHYTGIPAANVVFPDRGQYVLELRGTPKAGAEFSPFTFKNEILVATGSATGSATGFPTEATPEPSNSIAAVPDPNLVTSPESGGLTRFLPLVGIGVTIVFVLGGLWGLRGWKNRQDDQKTTKIEN